MVLELDKLYELKTEQQQMITKMKEDIDFWLISNDLKGAFIISKLNGLYVCLDSYDTPLSDELLSDFENVFGVMCDSVCECNIKRVVENKEYVKYSYSFCQSGGIY